MMSSRRMRARQVPANPWTHRLACALAWACTLPAVATTFVLEAERLELPGGWRVEEGATGAQRFLRASDTAAGIPAAGAVDLPHAGPWHLWVRSKDYPDYQPGTRTFSVRIGTNASALVFGRHGRADEDGWAWEDGGELTLEAGPNLVVLGEQVTSFARSDALVLTDNATYRPAGDPAKLGKQAAVLSPLRMTDAAPATLVAPPLRDVDERPVASISNALVRYSFHAANAPGSSGIVLRVAVRDRDQWRTVPVASAAECYWVVARPPEPAPRTGSQAVHPSWDLNFAPLTEVGAGTATVRTRCGDPTAPWLAGRSWPLRPSAARQHDAHTVELDFPATGAGRLTARWTIATNLPAAELALELAVSGRGHYSLGYAAPWETPSADADFLLLPFMYHGRRFPDRVVTLPSALTPTPLALINRGGFSCAVAGVPASIPFAWPSASNSVYVFGLRNAAGLAQPLAFSPVIGQNGARSDGAPVRARLLLWMQPGDWYASYRRIADDVFGLRDYRRPLEASLSDAALNLFDLMGADRASGWDATAKGPWNIESRNVVTHASPLTYLSYYLLTGDESFRTGRVLPSLEFLLSRPGPHFSAETVCGDNYYRQQVMRGPGSFYGAATHASAFALTRGLTPAFAEACFTSTGSLRVTRGGGHVAAFEDALALHRLTQERKWLDQAVAGGDAYIAANLARLPERDLGPGPFVNVSFVPDWEGLLHLYEATGERRFLDASAEGARWLLTTLWTQPSIPPAEITLHPGGVLDNARRVWWWGDGLFRLGLFEGPHQDGRVELPPVRLAETRAPAWTVSNVGLGLEQPCTYTRRGNHANILMNTWAPNLLRLAKATGDQAFRTAARNATIGRFGNYPGYYVDAMTDRYRRPDYPLQGPDVTCLYVHHIVPFAAYVADYLYTDAEMRSDGAVRFPSVRQCGYVWFDSRLYGHAPGRVFGRTAWPWLHRTAATLDNVNIDRVLAEGDGAFHAVLLNQTDAPQRARVRLDPAALGRGLEGARVTLRDARGKASEAAVLDGAVDVALEPSGLLTLTLEGVQIDVSTHRGAPPASFALPDRPATREQPVAGTGLRAIGTEVIVPPGTSRQLFVYVAAGLGDLRAATLRYRIDGGPEVARTCTRFPWEFSEKIESPGPVSWRVEGEAP